MTATIRPFDDRDIDQVVDLSLRAWEPVFASLEQVLGADMFHRQHPDWRADQRQAVQHVCRSEASVSVAEADGSVVGFVAVTLHDDRRIGEISMVAVDPDHQRQGTGAALTAFALDQIKAAGVPVAMVETGGDPGHAPARATYEQAGFTLLPIVRYFKSL